ncbi:MAG: hypothetical protein ABJI60_12860 [Kangiellaceae bacterium]
MLNYNSAKIAPILSLIIYLGLNSKMLLAEQRTSKDERVNDPVKSSQLPVIDEDFLIFLSEVDIQDGVEIAPIDMLDVEIDKPEKSLVLDPKTTKMKQVQKIEKTKENK